MKYKNNREVVVGDHYVPVNEKNESSDSLGGFHQNIVHETVVHEVVEKTVLNVDEKKMATCLHAEDYKKLQDEKNNSTK